MRKPPSASRVIITAFFIDFTDVLVSFITAILTGSVVMVAEVLEGMADLAASGFLLIGLIRSSKPSDKKHPFGYGLELYFWTMLASMVILGVTSTLSIYFGWKKLLNPTPIHNISLALIVLGVTACTNGYALSLSIRRLLRGRSFLQIREIFNHSSKIETKTTLVLDLAGTLASIFGFTALIFYHITGNLIFDGIGAIVVGSFLVIFGIILMIPIRELIIGQSASSEVEARIRQATLTHPDVKTVLELKTLHIGPGRLLVDTEIGLKNNLTTREIEGIIGVVKDNIKREVPEVKHILVELEAA